MNEDVVVIPVEILNFEDSTTSYTLEDDESKARVTALTALVSQYAVDVS